MYPSVAGEALEQLLVAVYRKVNLREIEMVQQPTWAICCGGRRGGSGGGGGGGGGHRTVCTAPHGRSCVFVAAHDRVLVDNVRIAARGHKVPLPAITAAGPGPNLLKVQVAPSPGGGPAGHLVEPAKPAPDGVACGDRLAVAVPFEPVALAVDPGCSTNRREARLLGRPAEHLAAQLGEDVGLYVHLNVRHGRTAEQRGGPGPRPDGSGGGSSQTNPKAQLRTSNGSREAAQQAAAWASACNRHPHLIWYRSDPAASWSGLIGTRMVRVSDRSADVSSGHCRSEMLCHRRFFPRNWSRSPWTSDSCGVRHRRMSQNSGASSETVPT